MPRPPSYGDMVNGIVKFIDNPCDAPYTVYFETLIPAAGEAILVLLDFGMDDVIRGFARPRGLRSYKHGRKGRRDRPPPLPGQGIPELGELIGENLPGAERAKGRHVSQGVKNLWMVDGVIQRGLWYWLVIDTGLTFLYRWSSLIMESQYCSKSGNHRAARIREGGSIAGILNWQALLANTLLYQEGDLSSTVGGVSVGPGTWEIQIAATGTNGFTLPTVPEICIATDPNGVNQVAHASAGAVAPQSQFNLVCGATLTGRNTYYFLARVSAGSSPLSLVMHYIQGMTAP